jgi:hypothetical protein
MTIMSTADAGKSSMYGVKRARRFAADVRGVPAGTLGAEGEAAVNEDIVNPPASRLVEFGCAPDAVRA